MEIDDKEKFLEAPLGAVIGTLIECLDEEDVDSGTLVIHMLHEDNGNGFVFNINCKRLEKNRSFLKRLFKR